MTHVIKFISVPYLIFFPLYLLLSDQAKKTVSFDKEIKPIFQANCNGCHQPAKMKGDYLMTEFDALLEGGETGNPAIVPGQPEQSYLYEQIKLNDKGDAEMPKGLKNKPLHPHEISKIKLWIKQGAKNDSPAGSESIFSMAKKPVYQTLPLIRTIDFTKDGKHIAQNGFHEVLIGEVSTGKVISRLVGISERIESVAFSPDSTKLAVAGGQPGRMGEVQIWDWAKQQLLLSHSVTYDTLYGVSWSPDGKSIAFGASDTAVRAIDSNSAETLVYMAGHDDWVRGTVFSSDGKSIFSVSRDKTVKQTDVGTERFVGNVTTHTPGILSGGQNSISVRPQKAELLVGGADGKAKLFRQATKAAPAGGGNPNQIREFKKQIGRIFSVGFNSQGNLGFSGSSFDGVGEVRCFEIETGKQLWAKIFDHSPVYAVRVSPNGKELAVGGYDGKIRFLSVSSGEIVRELPLVPLQEDSTQIGETSLNKDFESVDLIASESLPENLEVINLSIEPQNISLISPLDYSQILVTADLGEGRESDVTRLVTWSVSEGIGTLDNRGLFTPSNNGKGEIKATFGKHSVSLEISVSGLDLTYRPDFISEVSPIISKLGCNAGTCHGAKDGKNGFKLSLRGYDALYDIRGFTDDMASRRVNTAAPDRSLMLLKATGLVAHEGGQLTKHDSRYHRVIRSWIGNGANLDIGARRVDKIKLYPENPVVEEIGATQQFRVVAHYDDGTVKDVTREAFVTSGNGEVAEHDSLSLMTTLRRGEAPILARFEGRYAATTLTVMGDRSGFVWKEPVFHNRIDELVANKWKRMKIIPSDLAGDLDFLRRVYLDLTGLPPSVNEVSTFLEDKRDSRKKRTEVIDRLIGKEAYVEHWSNKWADMLQVNGKFLGRQGAVALRDWIEKEIRNNTPYDEFAKKVLTASGSNKENPPASYYKILRTPEDTMENTTHLFLATRFNCNKCHDHPFERWTQDQYYEMAAHFAQFKLEKDPASGKETIGQTAVERAKPLYEIVKDVNNGDVKHEKTGLVTSPDFPYPAKFEDNASFSRRERLAAWMTSKDNQYFARSYVNRIWGYLFGIGIIEPIDDIRAGNPPSNPELLDYLESEFIKSGFDIQYITRMICRSRTYQLSVKTNRWNADDSINFSHAMPRRLPAETLLDAVYTVTGSKTRFPGVPAGTRAASLPDVGIALPDGFLGTFGRPARETSCECERSGELQLGPIMALVSGPTVNDAISDPSNAIAKLAKEVTENENLINQLFLRILNRPATTDEINRSQELFAGKIDGDHSSLTKELENAEFKIKDWLQEQEKSRDDAISKAREELINYQTLTAEAVKSANDSRNAKIAKAKEDLALFDQTIPSKVEKWESDYASGKSHWNDLNISNVTSEMPGIKFEAQKDGSIFVGGRSAKGSYVIESTTGINKLTGIRIEAMQDDRLPKKGPGRAPNDGNFVLSELEVVASPEKDLTRWLKVGNWEFTNTKNIGSWKAGENSKFTDSNQSIVLQGLGKEFSLTSTPFYHLGPFVGLGFDQDGGPEKESIFDPNKKYAHAGKNLTWKIKPEWKDGQLFDSVFSAQNSSNYLIKIIESSVSVSLPLSLGSDDGIKVFLNGKEVFANNVGRGAAPDQEKLELSLRAGKNILLLKIHNGAGPSGFYYNSGVEEPILPSIALSQDFPAGSFVMQVKALTHEGGLARLQWGSGKAENQSIKIHGQKDWNDLEIVFVAKQAFKSIQFYAPDGVAIRSIKIFRNGLPTKLVFENPLATFSQGGYPVSSAIDGKIAPSDNGWAISPQMGKTHFASFQVKTPVVFHGSTKLQITMKQEFQSGQHSLGRFRVAVTDAPSPVTYGIPEDVKKIFAIEKPSRTPEQAKALIEEFKKSDSHRVKLASVLADANKPLPKDSKLSSLENAIKVAEMPIPLPPEVARLRRARNLSEKQLVNKRVVGAQDLTWALINTPAFLFNR